MRRRILDLLIRIMLFLAFVAGTGCSQTGRDSLCLVKLERRQAVYDAMQPDERREHLHALQLQDQYCRR